MAQLIRLPRFIDERGSLTVLDNMEDLLPFTVKRVFFINAAIDAVRAGHRHHTTRQGVICVQGHCKVSNHDGSKKELFLLDSPDRCLVLETYDWHLMHSFSQNAILLVLASECFNPNDYIYEPYKELVNDTV